MNYELRIMNLRYELTVRITNLRELRICNQAVILSLGIKCKPFVISADS
jgi:hypothetical protein